MSRGAVSSVPSTGFTWGTRGRELRTEYGFAAASVRRTVHGMDEAAAVAALPEPYAAALALRDGGADIGSIAAAAGVAEDAVPALLAVGERKLTELLASEASELWV